MRAGTARDEWGVPWNPFASCCTRSQGRGSHHRGSSEGGKARSVTHLLELPQDLLVCTLHLEALPVEHVVLGLFDGGREQVVLPGYRVCFHQLLGGEFRAAPIAHLALLDQLRHRAHHFLHRC